MCKHTGYVEIRILVLCNRLVILVRERSSAGGLGGLPACASSRSATVLLRWHVLNLPVDQANWADMRMLSSVAHLQQIVWAPNRHSRRVSQLQAGSPQVAVRATIAQRLQKSVRVLRRHALCRLTMDHCPLATPRPCSWLEDLEMLYSTGSAIAS